jgi:urease accessory protein
MSNSFRVSCRALLSPVLLCLLVLPGAAFAHPGPHHAADLTAGFLHPFTGIDHMLAMLAVGIWAARLGRRAMWILPAAFPAAMIVGAALSFANVQLPMIEPMIAISVMTLGVAVASGVTLPVIASATLIALFAVFHGYAHGLEAPVDSSMLGYAAGFIGATVLLHVLGVGIGTWFARANQTRVRQVSGSLIALTGAALLFF